MTGRTAVLILGIARSGTSAVAGSLAAAGLDFGNDFNAADWRNPKGNFENSALSRINQDILRSLGRSWSSVRPLPTGWRDTTPVRKAERKLVATLDEKFHDAKVFGIKDPRLVPLFGLYRDALHKLGVDLNVVVVRRRNAEVLASIRRSGYYRGASLRLLGPLLLWRYKRLMARASAAQGAIEVTHRDLLENPRAELERLCASLPLNRTGFVPDVDAACRFIDVRLYRNRSR